MRIDAEEAFLDVSRETYEKLCALEQLVRKWSGTINLVAKDTLPNMWQRHILDSVFIAQTVPCASRWLDVGSGAGFPGAVIAIIYRDQCSVTLVESDRRKAEFLRAARRELNIDVEIICDRVEDLGEQWFDVISARALAPLPKLLEMCSPLTGVGTTLILPKGRSWQKEVTASRQMWDYDLEVVRNPVLDSSVVLKITELERAAI